MSIHHPPTNKYQPPRQWIYIFTDYERFKIGRSSNPDARLKQMRTASSRKIDVINTIEVTDSILAEKFLHTLLHRRRVRGEWFDLDTESEALIRYALHSAGLLADGEEPDDPQEIVTDHANYIKMGVER